MTTLDRYLELISKVVTISEARELPALLNRVEVTIQHVLDSSDLQKLLDLGLKTVRADDWGCQLRLLFGAAAAYEPENPEEGT